jgi:hypothetical protein
MTETKRHRRLIPVWVVVVLGAIVTAIGLLWSSTLYDDRGEAVLDGPTATVLVAFLGLVGTILALLLQRSHKVEHELRPNSGSSARDAIDRTEAAATDAAASIVDVQDLARQALATAQRAERAAGRASNDARQLRVDVQAVRADLSGTSNDVRGIREDVGTIRDNIGRLADAVEDLNKE